ncbi:MAG: hypothetical protein O3B01_25140 [Planctomycetota bacterium]|nr:hypothetical protein [Planctomycetota bacterium]
MSENIESSAISKLVRNTVALWVKSLPPVALVLILCSPPAAWAYREIQLAGTDIIKMIFLMLFFQAILVVGSACVISIMESRWAGKKEWFERALTRSLRLFGWDLLVGFQSLIRFFLPFLPPSARRPEEYQPEKGSLADKLDRLPLTAGILYGVSKMGLRGFVAVLSKRGMQDCMGICRGRYLHIALWNFLALVTQCTVLGVVSNAAKATGQGAGLGTSIITFLIVGALQTVFSAYGLLLYHDCLTDFRRRFK